MLFGGFAPHTRVGKKHPPKHLPSTPSAAASGARKAGRINIPPTHTSCHLSSSCDLAPSPRKKAPHIQKTPAGWETVAFHARRATRSDGSMNLYESHFSHSRWQREAWLARNVTDFQGVPRGAASHRTLSPATSSALSSPLPPSLGVVSGTPKSFCYLARQPASPF